MPKSPTREARNHLRAWRQFRGMTQEELAERADTTGNVISQIESGDRGLSDKWLRRLAPLLGTTPGFLLDYDPHDLDSTFLAAALDVSPEHRPQVTEILKTFRRRS